MAWVAGNSGFSAGNVASLSTGAFSTTGTNLYMRALAYSGAGTPATPSGLKWDSAGANQSFSSFAAAITFNTNFRRTIWDLIAPSALTSKVVTVTWPSNQDETMVLADCYDSVNQSTPTRTPPTPGNSVTNAPSVNVTSVSGDTVLATVCCGMGSPNLLDFTSATVTNIRQKVTGTQIGGFESCAQGDATATGTSTTVSFAVGTSSGTATSVIDGVALITDAGGGVPDSPYYKIQRSGYRPRPFAPGSASKGRK